MNSRWVSVSFIRNFEICNKCCNPFKEGFSIANRFRFIFICESCFNSR